MKKRKSRLPVIVDILTHNSIGSQEELSKQLAIRGYIVTQATLSRDLKMLRTTKIATDMGGYRYIIADSHRISNEPFAKSQNTVQSSLHPAALSLSVSGNLVVIKTLSLLSSDTAALETASKIAGKYIKDNLGATQKIYNDLFA